VARGLDIGAILGPNAGARGAAGDVKRSCVRLDGLRRSQGVVKEAHNMFTWWQGVLVVILIGLIIFYWQYKKKQY
jgi:hypothetical protein